MQQKQVNINVDEHTWSGFVMITLRARDVGRRLSLNDEMVI